MQEANPVGPAFAKFRAFSVWAYLCVFGAMFGYASLSSSLRHGEVVRDTHSLWLWVSMAVVGLAFLGLKNRQITNLNVKPTVIIADLLVVATGLILSTVVPDFLGLVKGGIVLIVPSIYLVIYFDSLHRGKFVATDR